MSTPYTNEDFRDEDGKLRHASRGPVAVVIMAKQDPNALKLVKMLAKINIDRLETGYLDISQGKNREVIIMSRNTNTTIGKLPYLAFFYDGKLKSRYKGDVSEAALDRYFREKINEAATQSASSERKDVTSSSSRFSMAAAASGAAGKKPTAADAAKAHGTMIGANVAWRSDLKT